MIFQGKVSWSREDWKLQTQEGTQVHGTKVHHNYVGHYPSYELCLTITTFRRMVLLIMTLKSCVCCEIRGIFTFTTQSTLIRTKCNPTLVRPKLYLPRLSGVTN
jgi:hypothetical protein